MIPHLTATQVEQAFGLSHITLVFPDGVPQVLNGDPLINKRLARCWEAGTLIPSAERYQVKSYLIDKGFDLATIPSLISSVTAEGKEREDALMRWQDVDSMPKSHPLVTAVAVSLGLNLDQVWWSILEIE